MKDPIAFTTDHSSSAIIYLEDATYITKDLEDVTKVNYLAAPFILGLTMPLAYTLVTGSWLPTLVIIPPVIVITKTMLPYDKIRNNTILRLCSEHTEKSTWEIAKFALTQASSYRFDFANIETNPNIQMKVTKEQDEKHVYFYNIPDDVIRSNLEQKKQFVETLNISGLLSTLVGDIRKTLPLSNKTMVTLHYGNNEVKASITLLKEAIPTLLSRYQQPIVVDQSL